MSDAATDAETIAQVLRGDLEAFAVLVERYEQPVLRLIGHVLPSVHDTEDIAQEVFLAACRNLRGYDPSRGRFGAWLLTVARNKCIQFLRKKRAAPMGSLPDVPTEATPWRAMAAGEWAAKLHQALAALPPKQRMCFVLSEMMQLPPEEVSRIERARPGTVRSRLSRAKAALRQALGPFEGGVT